MRVLRVLFGIVLGAALAAGFLRALAEAATDLSEAIRSNELDDIRFGALWVAGIGAALAVVMLIGRSDPAVTIVCALGVLVPVGPAFANADLPTWAPSWLLPDAFVVLSPVYALTAGALVVAAAWGIGAKTRNSRRDDADDDRSDPTPDETAEPYGAMR